MLTAPNAPLGAPTQPPPKVMVEVSPVQKLLPPPPPPPPVAAVVWTVPSGNRKPPVLEKTSPATSRRLVGFVVPMPTRPEGLIQIGWLKPGTGLAPGPTWKAPSCPSAP